MTMTTNQPSAIAQIFAIDPALLQSQAAQEARRRGLLRAKVEALHATERLIGWARPLLCGVLIVSFLHIWHQIARIAPPGVPPLPLPAWTHWLSAALLTASVDATALYLVATRSAAHYARMGDQGRGAVWFFYLLTAALNSLFVLSYAPELPQAVETITPALSLLGALLLGLLVPVSIAALERARQVADVARLALLVEVETLRGVIADGQPSNGPQPTIAPTPILRPAPEPLPAPLPAPLPESAPATPPPAPIIGGRTLSFTLATLLAAFPSHSDQDLITPHDVRQRLRCSDGTAQRLLQAALEEGQLERATRGAYRRIAG